MAQTYKKTKRSVYTILENSLEGTYLIKGNQLFRDEIKLLIAQRKAVTKTKTPTFLLYISPTKERFYISSLYPLPDGSFKLDFKRKNYRLSFPDDSTCLIQKSEF